MLGQFRVGSRAQARGTEVFGRPECKGDIHGQSRQLLDRILHPVADPGATHWT